MDPEHSASRLRENSHRETVFECCDETAHRPRLQNRIGALGGRSYHLRKVRKTVGAALAEPGGAGPFNRVSKQPAGGCPHLGGRHLGRRNRIGQPAATRGQCVAVEHGRIVQPLIGERALPYPSPLNGHDMRILGARRRRIQRTPETAEKVLRIDPGCGLDSNFEQISRLARHAGHADFTGPLRPQRGRKRSVRISEPPRNDLELGPRGRECVGRGNHHSHRPAGGPAHFSGHPMTRPHPHRRHAASAARRLWRFGRRPMTPSGPVQHFASGRRGRRLSELGEWCKHHLETLDRQIAGDQQPVARRVVPVLPVPHDLLTGRRLDRLNRASYRVCERCAPPQGRAQLFLLETVGRSVVLRQLLEDDLFLFVVRNRFDLRPREHAGHQLGRGHRIIARDEREVDRRLLAGEGVHIGGQIFKRLGDPTLVEIVEAIEEQMLEVVGETTHSRRFVLRSCGHGNGHENRPRPGARP